MASLLYDIADAFENIEDQTELARLLAEVPDGMRKFDLIEIDPDHPRVKRHGEVACRAAAEKQISDLADILEAAIKGAN